MADAPGACGAQPTQAFVLVVWLHFQSVADRDEFIAVWRPLASWVKEHEPDTLAYELSIADSDLCKVQVYERYSTKADFTEVHQKSEPYLAFKEHQGRWRADHAVQVTGQSYIETGAGFHR